MDFLDAEVACGRAMLDTGCLERFHAVLDSGYGPRFSWMKELETDLQLTREDVEARLDEDTWLHFMAWREKEDSLLNIRMCEIFMKGIWYERMNPGEWTF